MIRMTRNRHKRNGKPRHFDRMEPSSPDVVALAEAMEPRFLNVCELQGRESGGGDVQVPQDLEVHFIKWREVLVRHRSGDRRNTPSEYESLKLVAQWTVSEKCRLCKQPDKILQWPD